MSQYEKLEHDVAKLTITVSPEAFKAALETAYHKYGGKYPVPGFRKGKAPRRIIESNYGPMVFYDAAFDLCWADPYEAAIKEHDLQPVDRPSVDITDIGEDKGIVYTAEVQLRPTVTLGQYKGIEIPRQAYTVTEEEVDMALRSEQEAQARYVDVERPVADKDRVLLDYAGTVDGVAFEGGTAQDQTLDIGSGTFIPGFEDQLIGAAAGEDREVKVTFPEKYHAENLAGKNAVFHVKVNSITKTELPELDDDFAQDNGFDTFDAYKADVAKKLQEIADTNYDVEIENALIEKAVANAQMDIPAAMIDDQLNYVMRDVEYSMMRQGLRMEDYLKYTGQTREQMAQQYRGEAENRVKIQLVLEAIRKAENIEPTAEDIDEQSAKQAKRAGQEVEAFKANLTDEHKAYLSDLAAIQKVCDLMKAGATVVDKKSEEAAETAEETKTEE